MPANMCTPNLHMLLCRLFDQETAHGCVARNLELWVERCIQYLKANLKFRITSCPERLFVSDYLMDLTLDKWGRKPEMLSFDDWCPSYKSLPLRGNEEDMDNEGDEDNRQLIGVGKKVQRRRQAAMYEVACSFVRRLRPLGWSEAAINPSCDNLRCYYQADIPGVGSVNSVGYSRARSRISYYVLYSIVTGRGANEREELLVAKVKSFLRLKPTEDQMGAGTLRLAVCDVFRPLQSMKDGSVWVISKAGALLLADFALELSGIAALLVSAEPKRPRAIPGRPTRRYYCTQDEGRVFLITFGNVSKLK